MCEPTTILAAASLGLQGIGGLQQGQAAAQAAAFDAATAEANARILTEQARQTKEAGALAEEAQLRRVARLTGTQRATIAANNLEMSGSALDLVAESAGEGVADAARIRANAMREAWGYEADAVNKRNQAAYSRYAGRQQRNAGILSAGASFLGGASQLSWPGESKPFGAANVAASGPFGPVQY